MPGGYPVHISRWTRLGSAHGEANKMLLLGEPEAVVAAACSPGVTAQMAKRVWWSHQSAEIARHLLNHDSVKLDGLGNELACYLLDYLPFEEHSLNGIQTIQHCLYAKLIGEHLKKDLWGRASRKNAYYVGFLLAGPMSIPLQETAHSALAVIQAPLSVLAALNNSYASTFEHFLQPAGRRWLRTLQMAMYKPSEPDVVTAIFCAIEQHAGIGNTGLVATDHNNAQTIANSWLIGTAGDTEFKQLLRALPESTHDQLEALLVMMQLGENTLVPLFRGRDASGTVMRKHLQPLSQVLDNQICALLN